MRRYHFKFRAETEQGVDKLIRRLPRDLPHLIKVYRANPTFPDVEVDLYTPLTLKKVRSLMSRIVDGHVMLETVAPHTQYTGARYYTQP